MGSTFAARRAGNAADTSANADTRKTTTHKVIGSLFEIPNSWLRIVRVSNKEVGNPAAMPIPASHNTSVNTIRITVARVAPRAIRMPISRVLCAVV